MHVNQMSRAQEAGLTDLDNQMEQVEVASCYLINMEIAINSLLLKRKQQEKGVEIANELKSSECITPLSCCHQSFYQSP